jgi:hypothetical protein
MYVKSEECQNNINSMNPENWFSSQPNLNAQIKKSLPPRRINMRFELPYTAPGKQAGFKSSLAGDCPVLCIDLNSDLAVPFFGKKLLNNI